MTSAPAWRANCIGHFQPGSVVTKLLPGSQNARQTMRERPTAPSVTSAAAPGDAEVGDDRLAQRLEAERRRIGVELSASIASAAPGAPPDASGSGWCSGRATQLGGGEQPVEVAIALVEVAGCASCTSFRGLFSAADLGWS